MGAGKQAQAKQKAPATRQSRAVSVAQSDRKTEHDAAGEQALLVRPSLWVGSSRDPVERLADRVAARVVGQLPSAASASTDPKRAPGDAYRADSASSLTAEERSDEDGSPSSVLLHGMAAANPADDDDSASDGRNGQNTFERSKQDPLNLRTSATGTTETALPPAWARGVRQAVGEHAHGLASGIRMPLEQAFGAPLDQVRLHTDSTAAYLTEQFQTRAFTLGRHIFFGAGQYRPETPDGLRLLAHELAHTLQSGSGAQTLRRDGPSEFDPSLLPISPGLVFAVDRNQVTQTTGANYRLVSHQGEAWVRIEWEGAADPGLQLTVVEGHFGSGRAHTFGVRVRSTRAVDISVDTRVHANRDRYMPTLFTYDFYTGGDITVDGQAEGHRWRCRFPFQDRSAARELLMWPFNIDDWNHMDPFSAMEHGQSCGGADDLERRFQDLPTFSDWREMEDYIRANRPQHFLGVMKPNGEFVAVPISEADLQNIASALRHDEAWEIEDVEIEADRPEFYTVTGLYMRGVPTSVHQAGNSLLDRYYASAEAAVAGYGSTAFQEAEIYRMGPTSFGRRPLTHSQALARWNELDRRYNATTITRARTPNGGPFHVLHVDTPRGPVEIDRRYFRGRDHFQAHAEQIDEYSGGLALYLADHPDVADDVQHYLRAELHRELDSGHTTRLQQIVGSYEDLANDLGERLYRQMSSRASSRVLHVLGRALNDLQPMHDNRARLREFLSALPFDTAERLRSKLTAIGVPAQKLAAVARVMSHPNRAARVLSGQTESEVYGTETRFAAGGDVEYEVEVSTNVSLSQFHDWLGDHIEGLQEFREKIDDRTINALNLEGDLGNSVRRELYRDFGFTELDPEQFPHDNITFSFMPNAADPTQLRLQTLGEQLFANYCARQEDIETLVLVGKITATVIATVVFIYVAEFVAAAAVGWLGWTGLQATVAHVAITSLVLTTLQQALHFVMTGDFRWRDALLSLGMNVAVLSLFRALQPVMQSTAQALARTRAFQLGGSLAEAGAARVGVSVTGGAAAQTGAGVFTEFVAFFAFGLAMRVGSQGELPDRPREWFFLLWESMAMAVLMRMGGWVVRPHMESLPHWARARRLGDLAERIDQLQGDRIRFQRDFFALRNARPHRLETELPRLMEEGNRLLSEQQAILEQITSRWRRQIDQAELTAAREELQMVRDLLQVARDLGGLRELNLQPVGERGEFTYRTSDQALEMARRFWGEDNVSFDPATGRIRIRIEGAEDMYLFPEGMRTQAEAFAEQRGSLLERMHRLEERTELFGVEDEAITQVLGTRPEGGGRPRGRLRPGARGEQGLREAEQLIETAEQVAEQAIAREARRIYRQWISIPRRAQITQQARQGELTGMSDADVGEAVLLFAYRQRTSGRGRVETVRTIQGLSAEALRGVFFAYRNGLNLPRMRGALRNVNTAQRNDVLETYAQMVEARVEGVHEAMADMMRSRNSLRGGMWEFAFVRSNIGIENTRALQRTDTSAGRTRHLDVVTHDGRRIELKDWGHWQHGKLERNFESDVLQVLGGDLAAGDARNLALLQYVFKPPAPMEIPAIRTRLRNRLHNMLVEANIGLARRSELLSMFDQHTGLVVEGVVGREGPALRERPSIAPPVVPPPTLPDQPEEPEEPEAVPAR